ncbi:MAG: leucine-rich repeat protein, partial [Mycoplasma sp.]
MSKKNRKTNRKKTIWLSTLIGILVIGASATGIALAITKPWVNKDDDTKVDNLGSEIKIKQDYKTDYSKKELDSKFPSGQKVDSTKENLEEFIELINFPTDTTYSQVILAADYAEKITTIKFKVDKYQDKDGTVLTPEDGKEFSFNILFNNNAGTKIIVNSNVFDISLRKFKSNLEFVDADTSIEKSLLDQYFTISKPADGAEYFIKEAQYEIVENQATNVNIKISVSKYLDRDGYDFSDYEESFKITLNIEKFTFEEKENSEATILGLTQEWIDYTDLNEPEVWQQGLLIPDMIENELKVTTIANQAFNNIEQISGDLIISNNVTSIGAEAFANTKFSGNLSISKEVTSIGAKAFASCGLSTITVEEGLYDSRAVWGEDYWNKNDGLNSNVIKSTDIKEIEKFEMETIDA